MKHSLFSQRNVTVVAGLLIIITISGWWQYSRIFPSTDNAYVNANVANIAAQITGSVQTLSVQNHQAVKAGQLLFTVDPKPFQVALDLAKANYALAEQQVAADAAAVDNAKAVVEQRQVEVINAQQTGARSLTLAAQGVLSKQAADDAKWHMRNAKALWVGAQAQLKQAIAQLGGNGAANARLLQAQAAVAQARLSLAYTQVTAVNAGVVENLTLRIGDVVAATVPLFSIIDERQWWVDANFKETQLARIKVGQAVLIQLDMYDHDFHGIVDSISAGSGSTFSLLPAENATGNWVKVAQRFPVRIHISDTTVYPLRVGASAMVTVDTFRKS